MQTKSFLSAVGGVSLALASSMSVASTETVTAFFATPSVTTTNSYSGLVNVTVSGIGQSAGTAYNDAFYLFADGSFNPLPVAHDPNWYHLDLSIGGVPLTGGTQSAYNILSFITPAGLPAYNPNHVYSFTINVTTPGQLSFGVSDGLFSDNSGAYEITVSQTPIPQAFWLFGSALAGLAAARQRKA